MGGFTLIELLVVILIIAILIAVSAPSFLGQTQKAHESTAKQQNAIGYKAASAFAVDGTDANGVVAAGWTSQGSYDGFTDAVLDGFEPELSVKTHVTTHSGSNLVIETTEGGRTCTLTVTAGILQPQTCAAASAPVSSPPPVVGTPALLLAGHYGPIYISPDSATLAAVGSSGGHLNLHAASGAGSDTPLGSGGTSSGNGDWVNNSEVAWGLEADAGPLFKSDGSTTTTLYTPASGFFFSGVRASMTSGKIVFAEYTSGASSVKSISSSGGSATTLDSAVNAFAIAGFSPDGQTVYYYYSAGGHFVLSKADVGGAGSSLILDLVGAGSDASVSPDGSKIAYAGSGGIYTISAAGGASTLLPGTADVGNYSPILWTPDSDWLIFANETTDVHIWAAPADGSSSGFELIDGSADNGEDDYVAIAPDGSALYYESYDPTYATVDIFKVPLS